MSAAHDLTETISNSNLTIQKVIELELRPKSIFKHLSQYKPKEHINFASHERSKFVNDGLQEFSIMLCNVLLSIEGIDKLILKHILHSQGEMNRKLDLVLESITALNIR